MIKCISLRISTILPNLKCKWFKKINQSSQRVMVYPQSHSQPPMALERRLQPHKTKDMELYLNNLPNLRVQETQELEFMISHQREGCHLFQEWANQLRRTSNHWEKWEDSVMLCCQMIGSSIQRKATNLIIMKVWDICQEVRIRITTRATEPSTIS